MSNDSLKILTPSLDLKLLFNLTGEISQLRVGTAIITNSKKDNELLFCGPGNWYLCKRKNLTDQQMQKMLQITTCNYSVRFLSIIWLDDLSVYRNTLVALFMSSHEQFWLNNFWDQKVKYYLIKFNLTRTNGNAWNPYLSHCTVCLRYLWVGNLNIFTRILVPCSHVRLCVGEGKRINTQARGMSHTI